MTETERNEFSHFKKQIYKYGLIIAVFCELISLVFLGWNPRFLYGLSLGTCIAIVNFNLLSYTARKILNRGRGAGLAVLGYMLRLILYGGGFYTSYKIGTVSGLATILGYVTLKIAIYYVYGFKPKFSESTTKGKQFNNLDEDEWATEKKTSIFKGITAIFKPMPDDENDDDGDEEENDDDQML